MALLNGEGEFLPPHIEIDENWKCSCPQGNMSLSAVLVHKKELIYIFSNYERSTPFLDAHPLFNELLLWSPIALMHKTTNTGFSLMSKTEYTNLKIPESEPYFSSTNNEQCHEADANDSDSSHLSDISSDDGLVDMSEKEDELDEVSDPGNF